MRRMDRVRLAVCGALAAGWLTVSAQVPQPFPGRPNPPRTVPPPPKTVPPPAETPRLRPRPSRSGRPLRRKPPQQRRRSGSRFTPTRSFWRRTTPAGGSGITCSAVSSHLRRWSSIYQNALKNRGTLVFDAPATHIFEIGRFREETMAFPPGVTVKDYTWNGSTGYINPKKNTQPARFPSVIQIVPSPPEAK